MTLKLFENLSDLKMWQFARKWAEEVYTVSGQKAFFQDTEFRNSIRDICVRMLACIVEAAQQPDPQETIQRILKAKNLLMESRTKLYAAVDLKYVSDMTFNQMFALATEVGHLFDDIIQYVRKSEGEKSP